MSRYIKIGEIQGNIETQRAGSCQDASEWKVKIPKLLLQQRNTFLIMYFSILNTAIILAIPRSHVNFVFRFMIFVIYVLRYSLCDFYVLCFALNVSQVICAANTRLLLLSSLWFLCLWFALSTLWFLCFVFCVIHFVIFVCETWAPPPLFVW